MNCDMDGKYTTISRHLTEATCGGGHVVIPVFVVLQGDAENRVEVEEKTRLINQVLELQHTLEGESYPRGISPASRGFFFCYRSRQRFSRVI